MKRAQYIISSASFGRRLPMSPAMERRSPSPRGSGPTILISTTTLRPSSVQDKRGPTRQSAPTAHLLKPRDGIRHNSCLPSSPTPGSVNYGTRNPCTPRSAQKTSSHTSKRGAPAGTPSTSWRCITKCIATTSRLRESPSISICSRTPNGNPDGREEQSQTRLSYSSRVTLCLLASASRAQMPIGKSAQSATRRGQNGRTHTSGIMPRQE